MIEVALPCDARMPPREAPSMSSMRTWPRANPAQNLVVCRVFGSWSIGIELFLGPSEFLPTARRAWPTADKGRRGVRRDAKQARSGNEQSTPSIRCGLRWCDGPGALPALAIRWHGSPSRSSATRRRTRHGWSGAWGGVDSNHRPADYESAKNQASYLRKFMNILVRAFTWLL